MPEQQKIIAGVGTRPMLPFLDEAEVRRYLRMADLVPAMARALADLSAGRVEQPVRVMLPVESRGFFAAMPAYAGALGAKLVTFFPSNQDVPTHHALIVLFRPETGEPMAIMDGRLITEMRTAAASAVATDLLARRDAAVLALLGSGRSEEHTSELQSRRDLVCRLLLEKKNPKNTIASLIPPHSTVNAIDVTKMATPRSSGTIAFI